MKQKDGIVKTHLLNSLNYFKLTKKILRSICFSW